MDSQSKGMRILYAIFLIAVTAKAVLSLKDRYNERKGELLKNQNKNEL